VLTLHPSARILVWLVFALFLPWLGLPALAALTLLLILTLLTHFPGPFMRQLSRTRWLLLSIFLVYALATPGENLLESLGAFSPTREGLHAGTLQVWRLFILLAALSLLLAATPGKQLLSGLLLLLRPWRKLGVPDERIAARVWLTLFYAEQSLHLKPGAWHDKLRQTLYATEGHAHPVALDVEPLARRDWLALAFALAMLGGLAFGERAL
jgi:energy-coupling factor transporter transmembrane protein EcfT